MAFPPLPATALLLATVLLAASLAADMLVKLGDATTEYTADNPTPTKSMSIFNLNTPTDTDDTDESEDETPPVTLRTIPDTSDQILVFQLSDGLDDEAEDEYLSTLQTLADKSNINSQIFILPSDVDLSKVANDE